MNLNVKQIFYSLQGEGGRQGAASIFIRLSGCNLNCDFCDTDFSGGEKMSLGQILLIIKQFPCQWIVWTGGEPTLQLTDKCLQFFKLAGFLQAIESNGSSPLSKLLDYTVISPKKDTIDIVKEMNFQVNEIRMPIQKGDNLPMLKSLPRANHHFISPVFTDNQAETKANIDYCVEQVKLHPEWRLSLQMHKWIGIE